MTRFIKVSPRENSLAYKLWDNDLTVRMDVTMYRDIS